MNKSDWLTGLLSLFILFALFACSSTSTHESLMPTPIRHHDASLYATPAPKELVISTPIPSLSEDQESQELMERWTFGGAPCPSDSDLGESKKREIFYQAVVEQDKKMVSDYQAANRITIRKFGISERVLQCITVEGIEKNWPIPPIP